MRTCSETLVLAPGEIREGVVVKVLQPAALRGIVVDEQGKPIIDILSVSDSDDYGGWGHGYSRDDGRFGMYSITPSDPFRIKVSAAGCEDYRGPEIALRPGEMRFVKVVMKKATHKY